MTRALKDLVTSIMGTRDAVVPSIQAFPPLDVEQIARELRLDARGQEAGRLGRPPEGSDAEDLVELDVLAEVERRARKAAEEYRSQLDLYDGRIRRALSSSDQRTEIEVAGQSVLSDFRVQVVDDLNHLHVAQREVEGREAEFERFRVANGLTRLPNIISRQERQVRTLLIAIVVLLEGILNGLFFAKGSETGLIGGIAQALGLSFLNIAPAILYAFYGIRLVPHARPALRTVGIIATVMYAGWALALNLLVAHFRDVFISHAGKVGVSYLWTRLSTAPLNLDDATSWVLAALGVGLSVVSMIDVSGMDDLYLGYGAVGRRRAEAIADYADEKRRYLAGLMELRDSAISDMIKVMEAMRNADYEVRLALDGRSRLIENYRGYLEHLADCYLRLIQQYREANLGARPTPPPARFLTRPPRPQILAFSPPPDLPDLQKDARGGVVRRMEHFAKAINEEFEKVVHEYDPVSVLTKSGDKEYATS